MVTFRNNNNGRRGSFRRNDRNFKTSGERNKFTNNFTNNDTFQRKVPGRNNHNAAKLIEKYNNLAREALSNGDKILSENYFQHAEHFIRVLEEKDAQSHKDSATKEIAKEDIAKDQKNSNGVDLNTSEPTSSTES